MSGDASGRIEEWFIRIPVPSVYAGWDGRLIWVNAAFASAFPEWAARMIAGEKLRCVQLSSGRVIESMLEFAVSKMQNQELVLDAEGIDGPVRIQASVRALNRLDAAFDGAMIFFAKMPGGLTVEPPSDLNVVGIADGRREKFGGRRSTAASLALRAAESKFLANLTHELRIPLNGIIGAADLLLETSLNRTQMDYIQMIVDSSESLLMIINDVLDYAKIETGQFRLEPKSIDLAEVVGDAVRSLAFRAHAKGLELVFRVESNFCHRVSADPLRIRQVVLNLLENAIKYTDEGEVLVEISSTPGSSREVWFECSVSDTGVGMSEADVQRLEDTFLGVFDVEAECLGHGLGLTICARLIQRMQGQISVNSCVNEGSRFAFRLPLLPIEDGQDVSEARQDSVHGLRVMVIEQHSTGRRILRDMLASWGVIVTLCTGRGDVETQLQAAIRSQLGFDVIIVDHNLRTPEGLLWAESLVQDWGIRPETILVLTTGRLASDPLSLTTLGIGEPLLKPPKQSELFQAILNRSASHQAMGSADLGPNPERAQQCLPTWKILVAEDNKVNQKLALGILGKMGHEVRVVSDGSEALERLERETFDLVLMDRQMPELDGVQTARIFRQRSVGARAYMPIVAMISAATQDDRRQCAEAGIDDHVSKPLRSKELLRKFGELIERFPQLAGSEREQPAGTNRRSHGQTDSETSMSGKTTVPQGEVDWARALHHSAGDEELLVDLLQTFLDDLPRLFGRIERAVETGDLAEVSAAAHSLKGSLGFLNTRTAHEACEHIELRSAGMTIPELGARWAECKARVLSVKEEVMRRLRMGA